jgi:uncharacterized RDD family membrane protein YckC
MGEEYNPYAAPDAEVADPIDAPGPGELDHATRGSRFLARLVDGILSTICSLPAYPLIFKWQFEAQGVPFNIPMTDDQINGAAVVGLVLVVLLFGYQLYLLWRSAQTIGKKALGIKIVAQDGSPASWGKIVGLRMFGMTLIEQVPLAGPAISLLNPLMIFRDNRRCMHDELAGTAVVVV